MSQPRRWRCDGVKPHEIHDLRSFPPRLWHLHRVGHSPFLHRSRRQSVSGAEALPGTNGRRNKLNEIFHAQGSIGEPGRDATWVGIRGQVSQ